MIKKVSPSDMLKVVQNDGECIFFSLEEGMVNVHIPSVDSHYSIPAINKGNGLPVESIVYHDHQDGFYDIDFMDEKNVSHCNFLIKLNELGSGLKTQFDGLLSLYSLGQQDADGGRSLGL